MIQIAFLFDNDGVLIDSTEFHWLSWQLLMKEDPELRMDYQQFVKGFGKRNDLILKEITPDFSEKRHQQWAQRKEELFRECARGKISLLPGMESFLKVVKQEGIPRIIASSTPKENLEMFISSTILGDFFDHYVSAEEVAHGKPAPDIFITAANHLGFDPKNCIVFEDAPAGIEAGKAAGSFVVALETTHSKDSLENYDLIFESPKSLKLKEIIQAYTLWKS